MDCERIHGEMSRRAYHSKKIYYQIEDNRNMAICERKQISDVISCVE